MHDINLNITNIREGAYKTLEGFEVSDDGKMIVYVTDYIMVNEMDSEKKLAIQILSLDISVHSPTGIRTQYHLQIGNNQSIQVF